jgi:hypothetical protein
LGGSPGAAATEDAWLAEYAAACANYAGAIEDAGFDAATIEGAAESEFPE